MTQTLGSNAKVKWDRPKDRLNRKATERDFQQILRVVVEVHQAWSDAVDGGVWAPVKESGRPSTHAVTDPTYHAVVSPTRRQLREAAKQASESIADARAYLEMAADILHRAQARQDPEVLAQFLEVRNAAIQNVRGKK
jgi:hypothetical protein